MADLNKAIKLKPDDANAYLIRGYGYTARGIYDQAKKDYDKAIELDPGFADAYEQRGILARKRKIYISAMLDFKNVIRIRPDYAEGHFNCGLDCFNLGRYSQAIDYFLKAIDLKSDYPDAYHYLMTAYKQREDTEFTGQIDADLENQPSEHQGASLLKDVWYILRDKARYCEPAPSRAERNTSVSGYSRSGYAIPSPSAEPAGYSRSGLEPAKWCEDIAPAPLLAERSVTEKTDD